jgi:cytochrome oxidase assembly protein ShyY1
LPLQFTPRWIFTLLTALSLPLFTSLGFWQWQRGEHRSEVWARFSRSDVPAVEASVDRLPTLDPFTRVRVEGVLDGSRQFLLDNISRDGRPGYEVLTMLRLVDGKHLLVNRGWLPFSGYRDRLPNIEFPATESLRLTGRLGALPTAGLASGGQPPPMAGVWPRVTTFPTLAQLSAASGESLLAPVLLLDADSGPGYLRSWQPPGISPQRNYSYAVQWWAFAALAAVLYLALNLKRVR